MGLPSFSNLGKSSEYNFNSLSRSTFNNHQIQSIRLMKSNQPFNSFEKNKLLKHSSSNFYMTGIEYILSENINLYPPQL